MATIVHIAEERDWQAALEAGAYRVPSLESQSFIHFSTPAQVLRVADAYYAGRRDMVLLVVDTDALTADLRYEAPDEEETSEKFPHLYGPLNLDAVTQVLGFQPGPDGTFALPPELSA
jgi:uncharacterized protein (DUF952 family)